MDEVHDNIYCERAILIWIHEKLWSLITTYALKNPLRGIFHRIDRLSLTIIHFLHSNQQRTSPKTRDHWHYISEKLMESASFRTYLAIDLRNFLEPIQQFITSVQRAYLNVSIMPSFFARYSRSLITDINIELFYYAFQMKKIITFPI